jgi:hypothetical protein
MGYIVNPPSGGGGTITAVNGWNVDNATPTAPIIKGLLGNPLTETLNVNANTIDFTTPVIKAPFTAGNFKSLVDWMGTKIFFSHGSNYRGMGFDLPAIGGLGNLAVNISVNPPNGAPLFQIDGQSGAKVILTSNITVERASGNVLKLGFFGTAPVVQQTVPNVPSGNVNHTEFNNLLQVLRNLGLIG